jgi:hypothetical protein
METSKRRQVLEKIATSDETGIGDKLRALDLLERLDSHPDADPEYAALYEFWKSLEGMTPEQLDRELEALGAPLLTGPSYEDDDDFEAAVERRASLLANEQTAELRREAHRLGKALKQAEARAHPPAPAGSGEAARSAPSATGMVPEGDRPLRIVPPEGIDLAEGWSRPSEGPVLTSFERKVRGEIPH